MSRLEPIVSVCIPAYNREQFLHEAIQSVIGQTYRNIEILVSDDASPADLSSVVKSFDDPRIRFFRQERNLGFIGNWNFCIDQSRGDYIKIMGDDDRLLPECIEKEVASMLSNKARFICSNYQTIDDAGALIDNETFNDQSFRLLDGSGFISEKEFLTRYFSGDLRIGLPAAITFEKSLIEETGLFDKSTGCPADADMWIRFMEKTDLYYQDETVLQLRWHTNNLSRKLERNFFSAKEHLVILHRHFAKILNGIDSKKKAFIFARYSKMILMSIFNAQILNPSNMKSLAAEELRLLKTVFFNSHK
ncbi:MAG: glycosyltransferase [Candidatus Taylorbacteria bacterium]|nr:glycosyltransferase [Candidatus Taylorbacteria bacterium]